MTWIRGRNRKVRFQFIDRVTTIEGVLAGETRHDYIVWAPKVLDGPEATVSVSGHVEIPKVNVLFKQVIG